MQDQARLPEFLGHFIKNTPPPPNEKLARTWHFEFWVAENTPLPGGQLELKCVETNRCIPEGYRLL